MLSPTSEVPLDKKVSRQSQPPEQQDYFSTPANNAQSDQSSENKEPPTPAADAAPPSNPTSPSEEKKKSGLFGKKFQMGFQKKAPRQSTEVKTPVAAPEEKSDDAASSKSSEKEDKIVEDNFWGTVQKIRHEYDEHLENKADEPLPPGIMPSLPIETPVLKPPPHTLIIIQEDNPESGGLADQYRGEISELGKEADALEKIAPMWLGELLLRVCCPANCSRWAWQAYGFKQNQIPFKDTVKVSFVLHPFEDALPSIASPDGNARLNANRMLRAKVSGIVAWYGLVADLVVQKIIHYIAERIEAPAPPAPRASGEQSESAEAEPVPEPQEGDHLKPEEYLELYCQGMRVDPDMTLATLRVHIW